MPRAVYPRAAGKVKSAAGGLGLLARKLYPARKVPASDPVQTTHIRLPNEPKIQPPQIDQPCRLFNLPLEIREMIWSAFFCHDADGDTANIMVIGDAYEWSISDHAQAPLRKSFSKLMKTGFSGDTAEAQPGKRFTRLIKPQEDPNRALLLTCRQAYAETKKMYHDNTEVILRPPECCKRLIHVYGCRENLIESVVQGLAGKFRHITASSIMPPVRGSSEGSYPTSSMLLEADGEEHSEEQDHAVETYFDGESTSFSRFNLRLRDGFPQDLDDDPLDEYHEWCIRKWINYWFLLSVRYFLRDGAVWQTTIPRSCIRGGKEAELASMVDEEIRYNSKFEGKGSVEIGDDEVRAFVLAPKPKSLLLIDGSTSGSFTSLPSTQ